MLIVMLFTHPVLNFLHFIHLSRVQYKLFKMYPGILKFQLDHKRQKVAVLSYIL